MQKMIVGPAASMPDPTPQAAHRLTPITHLLTRALFLSAASEHPHGEAIFLF